MDNNGLTPMSETFTNTEMKMIIIRFIKMRIKTWEIDQMKITYK